MIIQDADEFYTADSWQILTNKLKKPETLKYDCIKTPYFTFWKTPAYVLHHRQEGIKNGTTTFAINTSSLTSTDTNDIASNTWSRGGASSGNNFQFRGADSGNTFRGATVT